MRRIPWPGVVFALVVVGSFFLHRAAMGGPTAEEAGVPQLPQVQDVSGRLIGDAPRYGVTGQRATVPVRYGDGAFYLADRAFYRHWDGAAESAALRQTFGSSGPVGVHDGVVAVAWCEEGDAELAVRLRDGEPRRARAGFDAVTDVDLDLGTGDVAISSNGEGAAGAVLVVPPGDYRARFSLAESRGCAAQAFALDLWPRRDDSPPRVVVAAPTG